MSFSASSEPNRTAKPKTFRVATEGATCDGRALSRDWIAQMAKNYDPKKYGARVNLEHFRGILPDGPFRAYGDVTALAAKEVEDGKLALFATIDPTADLVAFSKARQKIYTSVEVDPKFADTGEAYLVGLAVTDSPASLGCEMLAFAAGAQVNPLAARKTSPETLFTEAEAVELAFDPTPGADAPNLLERVKSLFSKKARADDAALADVHAAVLLVAEQTSQALAAQEAALLSRLEGQARRLDDLVATLSREPAHPEAPTRAPATGAPAVALTDF